MPEIQTRDASPEISTSLIKPSTPCVDAQAVIPLEKTKELIFARDHTSPRRLIEPGPTSEQIESLFSLCAAAPDHGLLVPWRFVVIPASERHHLAEVFANALLDRAPEATEKQLSDAREKAYRAPFLAIAIAKHGQCEPDIPILERMISMGAAIQNMLLGGTSLGFGSGLTSGRTMKSGHLRALLSLEHHEFAICCVNIGTIDKVKMRSRARPAVSDFVCTLEKEGTLTSSR